MITPPAGVTVEKSVQSKADAVKFDQAGADFNIIVTSSETGVKTIKREIKFAVAQPTTTSPQTELFSFSVTMN